MKKLTYQQAYDKIIQDYFNDRIRPIEPTFCFCGTLCGDNKWFGYTHENLDKVRHNNYGPYKGVEYARMEHALLIKLPLFGHFNEDELFAGMSAALDELKQIHIERGEVIDEVPVFTKRLLLTH